MLPERQHDAGTPRRVAQKDLPLLNDRHAAMQHEKHHGMAWTMGLLVLLVATFLVWAWFSNVEEVTRGQGSVIPSSREQVIQSLDPGVLSELRVREGDLVEAGQVLVKLDTARSSAVFRESRNKVEALQATAARLRSEAHAVPLRFPPGVPPELVARETAAFHARTRAVNESVQGLLQSKKLLDHEIAITEPMAAKGVVSEVEILRMKRQANELQLQMTERRNKFQSDANTELVRVEAELAQSEEAMTARADPVTRSEIKAPLRGVVKNIRINTVGGVIGVGQEPGAKRLQGVDDAVAQQVQGP